jgi:hypothetical protein
MAKKTKVVERQKLMDMNEQGLSQRAMAEKLNCSQATIKYWLKVYGVSTNRAKVKNVFGCPTCGTKDPEKFGKAKKSRRRKYCKSCDNIQTCKRLQRYKQDAVDYKGGKCEICGYSKYTGSLDFHHLDPKGKDPNFNAMRNWKLERRKDELDKCALLCRNCHAEVHAGIAQLG